MSAEQNEHVRVGGLKNWKMKAALSNSIDWNRIREKLPVEKTPEDKVKRVQLFEQFDPNGNGYLSLAEVDRGCRDVLGLHEIFECKKVIMRAFQAAKGANNAKNAKGSLGPDFVEKCEFRLLLLYLKEYFEIWQMFEKVDSGDDYRVNYDEFKQALPMFKRWGFEVKDPKAEFKVIDRNGGGEILFDEFADWALKRRLDMEEGED